MSKLVDAILISLMLVLLWYSSAQAALNPNCASIRDRDMRNYCANQCSAINNYDLKQYCYGRCSSIRDNDMKYMCRAEKKAVIK